MTDHPELWGKQEKVTSRGHPVVATTDRGVTHGQPVVVPCSPPTTTPHLSCLLVAPHGPPHCRQQPADGTDCCGMCVSPSLYRRINHHQGTPSATASTTGPADLTKLSGANILFVALGLRRYLYLWKITSKSLVNGVLLTMQSLIHDGVYRFMSQLLLEMNGTGPRCS
ncbi:hypothetical protein Cgig2_009762 [Carnegiea gigantea]|uniref:Uncharacterized protein n=1 Tax=Carnegiea gigantea TaxID=171969 RepID=A0A9Q1JUX8_9CARY|nr:hypothetical protein Cgig2_009762 [Carnegiea gigantea]